MATLDSFAQQMGLTAAGNAAQTTRPPIAAKPSTLSEAKAAGQKFEAMFIGQMMQAMFSGIKTDKEFGGGSSEEMFRPMLIDEYAKMTAKRGGFGIADAVTRTLLHAQEAQG